MHDVKASRRLVRWEAWQVLVDKVIHFLVRLGQVSLAIMFDREPATKCRVAAGNLATHFISDNLTKFHTHSQNSTGAHEKCNCQLPWRWLSTAIQRHAGHGHVIKYFSWPPPSGHVDLLAPDKVAASYATLQPCIVWPWCSRFNTDCTPYPINERLHEIRLNYHENNYPSACMGQICIFQACPLFAQVTQCKQKQKQNKKRTEQNNTKEINPRYQ